MRQFVLTRSALLVVAVLGITAIAFWAPRLMDSDPCRIIVGPRVSGGGVTPPGWRGWPDNGPLRPGGLFRDCSECPEMVVLGDGRVAMGRYEVTVGEYRAFAVATGGTGDNLWRNHRMLFKQTDQHPVTFVSWEDAQAYVLWLSRRTGAPYRLPTGAEWARAAAGSPGSVGCSGRLIPDGTCSVGSYSPNAAGLSDMVGNVHEWTSDCWEGDCNRRALRGSSWFDVDALWPAAGIWSAAGSRGSRHGFRVSRTLD